MPGGELSLIASKRQGTTAVGESNEGESRIFVIFVNIASKYHLLAGLKAS